MMMKTKLEIWIDKVNGEITEYYEQNLSTLTPKLITYKKGSKYVKLIQDNSVWGFVAMKDDPEKNEKMGDLLKAATWHQPAKHSRGNIFDGTARYSVWGPEYLI